MSIKKSLKRKKIRMEDFVPARDPVTLAPGQALAVLRKLQGLSQNQLSKLTGISQANISSMEKGRHQIGRDRALVLAKALKVHPAVILFSDYEPKSKAA